MTQILGQGTTFNLPNYVGELFNLTPADTPFLSMIGGLTGGRQATSTEHEWQAADLREGETRARLEGAAAPAAESRSRLNLSNVVQVHQEAVELSYTKLAAIQQRAGVNNGQSNPVTDELGFQVSSALKSMALDIEHGFINGVYHKPSDNTTARKTRGLIAAVDTGINSVSNASTLTGATTLTGVAVTAADSLFTVTHGLANNDAVMVVGGEAIGFSPRRVYYVRDKATTVSFKLAASVGGPAIVPTDDGTVKVIKPAAAKASDILDLLQQIWDNGGLRETETATALVGSTVKRVLSREFITTAGYQEQSRNVGGVDVQMIETDFGRLNVALSRYVPADMFLVASAEQCAPVFLPIPGKGFLFVEDLAKGGAAEKQQLYGEIGLEYGNPLAHGYLRGISAAKPA